MNRTLPALALLAALSACATAPEQAPVQSAAGRYSAAAARLDAAEARWDKASQELIAANIRCDEKVEDTCVAEAERLASELQSAADEGSLAEQEIEAARKAQADAFTKGFLLMQQRPPR